MCVVDFECDILVNRSLTFAQDSAPTTTDHAPCSGGLVRQPPQGSSKYTSTPRIAASKGRVPTVCYAGVHLLDSKESSRHNISRPQRSDWDDHYC